MYSNFNYKLQNTYVFNWESDFFCISTSNYIYEIEIKISRSDFKNEFNKTVNFKGIKKIDYLIDNNETFKPNKFIYACPYGLIKKEDIDKNFGLIYINPANLFCKHEIIQNARFLHKEKLFNNKKFVMQLCKKYYYRYLETLRQLELRQVDIKFNQKRLYSDYMY